MTDLFRMEEKTPRMNNRREGERHCWMRSFHQQTQEDDQQMLSHSALSPKTKRVINFFMAE